MAILKMMTYNFLGLTALFLLASKHLISNELSIMLGLLLATTCTFTFFKITERNEKSSR
jgi:hypothetical protein